MASSNKSHFTRFQTNKKEKLSQPRQPCHSPTCTNNTKPCSDIQGGGRRKKIFSRRAIEKDHAFLLKLDFMVTFLFYREALGNVPG